MHRVLAKHENLEDKRKALSELLNRPVYIASRLYKTNITHVKYPGSDVYVKAPGELCLFLSNYTDNSTCVKREDYTVGINKYSDFYYDLEESKYLSLVYPTNLKEDSKDILYGFEAFRHVGLSADLNSRNHVRVGDNTDLSKVVYNEFIPEELQPYVCSASKGSISYLRNKLLIHFTCSEYILNPKLYKKWHLSKEIEAHTPYKIINAPGWYPEKELYHDFGETQTMGIVDKDPGQCVVCRGKSGERRHIGSIRPEGNYVSGLICKACAPGVFKEWKKLLEL